MKFGVLQFFAWTRRSVPLEVIYERAMNRIEVMDRSGYDAVWLAEHHFTDYSVCPSVHMMGLHIASKTERLRIGTAVSLAALYHPLRLAEEVAMLDLLSGGRVNWGAGRGFDPREFNTFGVPLDTSKARFREAVDIVLAAWQNERLSWHSDLWQFDNVEVLPKPLQQPHPPVWVAAGSDDAIEWAGVSGYTAMLGPHAAFDAIGRQRELFLSERQRAGHPSTKQDIPICRFIAVADTDREAERIARAGAGWVVDTYKNESKGMAQPTRTVERGGEVRIVDPVDAYLEDIAVWGSPARVIDELERLREELPLEYLMCAPLSHSSFTDFTEKVMPHFT
ncbi:MAG: LLM class flavin-dependent oxidoreductase [Gammaproteobacteria bacterium]|nr:LLM class flavin-dependent oxidoreductase [Gammaproteobacteria bacterium]